MKLKMQTWYHPNRRIADVSCCGTTSRESVIVSTNASACTTYPSLSLPYHKKQKCKRKVLVVTRRPLPDLSITYVSYPNIANWNRWVLLLFSWLLALRQTASTELSQWEFTIVDPKESPQTCLRDMIAIRSDRCRSFLSILLIPWRLWILVSYELSGEVSNWTEGFWYLFLVSTKRQSSWRSSMFMSWADWAET